MPTFSKSSVTTAQLMEALAKHGHTLSIAKDVHFFSEEAPATVLARGDGDTQGFLLTTEPLLWSPEPGSRLLVATGRSGKTTSFVVVFYADGEQPGLLAGSFIMEDEPGPVVLAYNGYIRPRLHFSTCWGCLGETGKILHRSGDVIAISQP